VQIKIQFVEQGQRMSCLLKMIIALEKSEESQYWLTLNQRYEFFIFNKRELNHLINEGKRLLKY
jgi:hypothetical protein